MYTQRSVTLIFGHFINLAEHVFITYMKGHGIAYSMTLHISDGYVGDKIMADVLTLQEIIHENLYTLT